MKFVGRDALRFLGVKGTSDDALRARLADAAERVLTVATPNWTARLLPLQCDGEALDFGGGVLAVQSSSLARCLRGCDRAFLFAATLGAGVDRLVRGRQAVGEMADAAMLQAVAGELADSLCEDVVAELARNPAVAGCRLRPRFSPGYGDCPLSIQPAFLAALDATRRVGISLTGANLMVPTKSVTAFVGVEKPAASGGWEESPPRCHGCDVQGGRQDTPPSDLRAAPPSRRGADACAHSCHREAARRELPGRPPHLPKNQQPTESPA